MSGGSSNSSGDDDDDEEDERRRRPRHEGRGRGKDKPKLLDEDDEATDSADEGMDDTTPNSMVVDFPSPQSNQSEGEAGSSSATAAAGKSPHYPLGIGGTFPSHSPSPSGVQGPGSTHRPTSLTPDQFETKTTTLCSGTSGSAEVVDMTQGKAASGTISVETMGPKESSSSAEPSSAVNMIVGYGVPASVVPPRPLDKSPPESDLGTPTQDSPSPLGASEEKMTPLATPVPVTPVLSPALTLLPQVSEEISDLLFTCQLVCCHLVPFSDLGLQSISVALEG